MRGKGPVPTHGFVGRREELDLVSSLLMSGPHRLLTVIGPGGIGKTRLAAEAVRRARAGGIRVHWVPLSRVSPGAEVEAVQMAAASAVIEADISPRSAFDALVDTLRENDSAEAGRRVVLVLDNGEHVANAVAHLISDLLEQVPDLTIMATSRGPIGWADERLINVPQLPASDALELFGQRAELVGHTVADEEVATEICAHVHHNPLYIQLVAARLRYQSLKTLRAGLTGRDDDGRLQWGFAEVIAWSYNLCSSTEKLLFRRLSVFAPADTGPDDTRTDAGAYLEAIRAVCSDDEAPAADQTHTMLSSWEIAGLLEALADQSLITIHIGDSGERYAMHESLRVFASERLRHEDPTEPARLARRHLRYYQGRAVEAAARWFSADELEVVGWAQSAWANIVIALDTAAELPGEAVAGLRICRAMIDLRTWILTSIRDIRRYTERCLQASATMDPQPTELQMDVRSALVWLTVRQGSQDAEQLLEECIATCLADPDNTDWRDHPEADYGLPAVLDLARGTYLFMRMRDKRAIVVLELAMGKFRQAGDPYEVWAAMFASLAAALLDSAPKAHTIARRAVAQGQASGATWTTSWVQLGWAVTLIEHGDPQEAARVLREALKQHLVVGDQWGAMWSVVLLTWALAHMITGLDADRDHDRHIAIEIAQLIGVTGTVQHHLGVQVASMGTFADQTAAAVAAARAVLGEVDYTTARTLGAGLNLHDELRRVALGRSGRRGKPEPVTGPWGKLTAREQQIALQVVAGKSNKAIATRDGVSTRTVDTQVSSILDKLGIKSRVEIGSHVPADRLDPPASPRAGSGDSKPASQGPTTLRRRP